MSGLWDTAGIPHKGWECIAVQDLEPEDECGYASCQMCGNERIRYVHLMKHDWYCDELEVGCICAEKMSDDYVNPRQKEKALRNRAARKAKWLSRNWKVSQKGNSWLKASGIHVSIFRKAAQWSFCIDGEFSCQTYPTEDTAKLAAFDSWWQKLQDWRASPFNAKRYTIWGEALWGAYFAVLNWKTVYRPVGFDGWQPTFLICGPKNTCYVHVELRYRIDEKYFSWFENNCTYANGSQPILIVGHQPFIGEQGHPVIGWTSEIYEEGISFEEAPIITDDQGRFDFCHTYGSYEGRLSGYYEGGHWPLETDPLEKWLESQSRLK